MKKPFTLLSSLLLAVTFCLSFSVTAAALESTAGETAYFAYFSSEKLYEDEQLIETRYEHLYEIEDGNLYKLQFISKGSYWSKNSELLISDGSVTDYVVANNDLIFVMNNMIYCSNWDATNVNLVFALPQSLDGDIKSISANEYLIWFQVGDSVYRLYRPTNALDFIYSNSDMLWWRPISNYAIEYAVYSEEYLKAKQDGVNPDEMSFFNEETRYQYNAFTDKTLLEYQESPDSEWATYEVSSRTVSNYPSYSTTIAGKRIPESSYPIGCFISSNGQKCTHHTVSNNDNCNINGSCGCLKLGNIKGLGTGIQCMGFAKQIYWDLFGTNIGTRTADKSVGSGKSKAFLMSLHPGAYIRSKGHSLILVKATSTYADFYHANYQGPCQVSVSKFTYSDFERKYSTLSEVYNPPHTYSSSVSTYDKKYHYYKCTGCDEQESELHSFVASGNKQVCSVCKYSVVVSR